jgi:hypothetical protein
MLRDELIPVIWTSRVIDLNALLIPHFFYFALNNLRSCLGKYVKPRSYTRMSELKTDAMRVGAHF